jgi:hypothetical protein
MEIVEFDDDLSCYPDDFSFPDDMVDISVPEINTDLFGVENGNLSNSLHIKID